MEPKTYIEFLTEVKQYILKYTKNNEITETEENEIIKIMFDSGSYTVQETGDHLISVRGFNSRHNIVI